MVPGRVGSVGSGTTGARTAQVEATNGYGVVPRRRNRSAAAADTSTLPDVDLAAEARRPARVCRGFDSYR
jgi:hypothetical protein